MRPVSWIAYMGFVVFLSVVFTVFYAVALSVLRGVLENYRRYYQKADLQWTGPALPKRKSRSGPAWLLAFAVATAWAVVHLVIFG